MKINQEECLKREKNQRVRTITMGGELNKERECFRKLKIKEN